MSKKLILIVIIVVVIVAVGYGIYYSKMSFEKIIKEQQITERETADEINGLREEIKFLQETIQNTNLDLRIVSGLVDKDGKIKRGTGFSVDKNSACGYKIIFSPSFNSNPIVVASIDDAAKPAGFIRVINFSLNNRVDITTMSDYDPKYGGGTCDDRGFSFIAIGSR